MEFSDDSRDRCAEHGIDIEESYKGLMLEVRIGGLAFQRITAELEGLTRSNAFDYECTMRDRHSSRPGRERSKKGSKALTAAEKRVLTALAGGATVPGYARAYGRSVNTIRDQVASARRKLDAKTATMAIAVAIRSGAIQPPAR